MALILPYLNLMINGELDGNSPLSYRKVTAEERDAALLRSLEFLASTIESSGVSYLAKWERGWAENLAEFEALEAGQDVSASISPKFVRKNQPVKLRGEWIMPKFPDFEKDWVHVLRDVLAKSYFENIGALYEFGAGTGHNLVHLSQLLPAARLFGYDWSINSVNLQKGLAKRAGIPLQAERLDLFDPKGFRMKSEPSGSALLTVGTVEQLGTNYQRFLNLVRDSGFGIVVHIETTYELYDPMNLVDYLSMRYLEKRNWSRGYFAELAALEREGALEILEQGRTFGSFFHEGYTLTVWRPRRRNS